LTCHDQGLRMPWQHGLLRAVFWRNFWAYTKICAYRKVSSYRKIGGCRKICTYIHHSVSGKKFAPTGMHSRLRMPIGASCSGGIWGQFFKQFFAPTQRARAYAMVAFGWVAPYSRVGAYAVLKKLPSRTLLKNCPLLSCLCLRPVTNNMSLPAGMKFAPRGEPLHSYTGLNTLFCLGEWRGSRGSSSLGGQLHP
jgi:hypothetical protein